MPRIGIELKIIIFALVCSVAGISAQGQTQAVSLPTALHDESFFAGEAMLVSAPLDSNAFLNQGYPIDSLGYVDMHILGRVQVAGHSRDEIEAFFSEKFANYLRDTHLSVIPAIRLTLLGSWVRPGQYYVNPRSTLFEAVRPSGGIAGERTLNEVRVQRGEATTDISFLNAYSAGISLAKAGIRSGDMVVIPIPRENTGFWYWFRESVSLTAQVTGVVATVMSAYVTYLLLQDRQDSRNTTTQPTVTP